VCSFARLPMRFMRLTNVVQHCLTACHIKAPWAVSCAYSCDY